MKVLYPTFFDYYRTYAVELFSVDHIKIISFL